MAVELGRRGPVGCVVTPDGQRWRYRYDPMVRRIAKQRLTADGSMVVEQVEFTWDGSVLVEQHHVDGSPHARTTIWDWEPNDTRVISQTERISLRGAPQARIDERFYAIVTDLVGTPTELVDSAGQLWRANTTLRGAALSQADRDVSTPLRFPGQCYDPESRPHYNYHRYYDPSAGS